MNRYIVVGKAGYEGEPDRKVCLSYREAFGWMRRHCQPDEIDQYTSTSPSSERTAPAPAKREETDFTQLLQELLHSIGFGTIESERRSVIVAVQYDKSSIIFQRFKIKVESADRGLIKGVRRRCQLLTATRKSYDQSEHYRS